MTRIDSRSALVVAAMVGSLVCVTTLPAAAQGPSAEQTAKDQAECQALARQSSGYDPAATAAGAPSDPHVGGRVRGAAVGAAAGRTAAGVQGRQHEVYENADSDAKREYRQNRAEGAGAAGAVVGASRQRQERRADRREQQAAEEQQAQAKAAYEQAYEACLASRGAAP